MLIPRPQKDESWQEETIADDTEQPFLKSLTRGLAIEIGHDILGVSDFQQSHLEFLIVV